MVRLVHLTAREWTQSHDGVPPQDLVKFRGVYMESPKAKERRFPTADSRNGNAATLDTAWEGDGTNTPSEGHGTNSSFHRS